MDDPIDAESLLCSLVDIESTTGNEEGVMLYLEEVLGERGMGTSRLEMEDGRFNLLASLGSGEPVLCLNAHSDTMPPSGESLPRPRSGDGRVSGLGACDDKASVTSMLLAISRLREEELRGRLDLLISVDEEVSSRGVRTCVEKGYRCDYAIVGEPTGLVTVTAHSGLIFLDLLVEGSGGHGSSPWKGKNAIRELMSLYKEIEAVISEFPAHPLVGRASTNLGRIEGGDAHNRIADRCEARFDVRVMPGMSVDEALSFIERTVGERASLHVYKKGDPMETGPSSRLLGTVLEVQKEVMGRAPDPMGFRGWTEADPLRNVVGADTLVLGPGKVAQAHSPDEFVAMDEVELAADIYVGVARRLLAG
jgi:acetylornithine deacetylase/succinyl-diaminopimelate desuccinylase-like protein